MKYWQAVAYLDTDQLLDIARISEETGFHGLMVSDHLFYPERLTTPYPYTPDGSPPFEPTTSWPDPWVLVGAMAAVTTRLRFTTNVYVAAARHPFVVAKAVGTASVLSGGRVALGVGAGWMREEFDAMGEDYSTRGKRLDEMLEVLRALWAGGMVEHHGTYYDFDRLSMSPVPAAPVPIWCGGDSEPALRRAARLDGWIGNLYPPDEALEHVGRLQDRRRAAGTLDRDDYEVVVAVAARPEPDLIARLEDAGVTSTIHAPWMFTRDGTSLDARRTAIERFAERVIARRG